MWYCPACGGILSAGECSDCSWNGFQEGDHIVISRNAEEVSARVLADADLSTPQLHVIYDNGVEEWINLDDTVRLDHAGHYSVK